MLDELSVTEAIRYRGMGHPVSVTTNAREGNDNAPRLDWRPSVFSQFSITEDINQEDNWDAKSWSGLAARARRDWEGDSPY